MRTETLLHHYGERVNYERRFCLVVAGVYGAGMATGIITGTGAAGI